MTKRLLLSLLFVLCIALPACGADEPLSEDNGENGSMQKIGRAAIASHFDHTRKLRQEGRATWDIDEICRWSFFFTDQSKEKLTLAGMHLAGEGYEVVGLLPPNEGDTLFFFRVDRVEKHSVDSLLVRNDKLYEIARKFQLDSYDGMDCGAIDGP